MNSLQVIGVGSPFRNDDTGWRVIDYLRHVNRINKPIELLALDRPGINLLHFFRRSQQVILIDSVMLPERHGEVLILGMEQLLANDTPFSSHSLDVANTLQLADKLHMLPGDLKIIGLAIDPEIESEISEAKIAQLAQTVVTQCMGATGNIVSS